MDIFMLNARAYIKAPVAGSCITFSTNIFTFIILLVLLLFSGCLNVQITILQLDLHILFLKSRKINLQFIIAIYITDICLHHILHLRISIGSCLTACRISHKIIK